MLAAGFYFDNYLARGAGLITFDKGIGALAVAAWVLEWAGQPAAGTHGPASCGCSAPFCCGPGFHRRSRSDMTATLVTSLRYLIFATLFFLVIQTVRGDRRRADMLIRVLVAAAVVASVIALVAFFGHHVVQASGPIKDPNDFGFILASTVPTAFYELRWGVRWSQGTVGPGTGSDSGVHVRHVLPQRTNGFGHRDPVGRGDPADPAALGTGHGRMRGCGRWCRVAFTRPELLRSAFIRRATWPRRT